MDNRKNKDRSDIRITFAELMREVEKYQPKTRKRVFTPEQDKFLIAAKKKKMSIRDMKKYWEKAWDSIGRNRLAEHLRELEE